MPYIQDPTANCVVAHFPVLYIQDPTAYCVIAHFPVPYIQHRTAYCVVAHFSVPYIQDPTAYCVVAHFPVPIFRIQMCNNVSFRVCNLFACPIFGIVTQNPTTLSPTCQTSRPGTFYHNTIFRMNILKRLEYGRTPYKYGCAAIALL